MLVLIWAVVYTGLDHDGVVLWQFWVQRPLESI